MAKRKLKRANQEGSIFKRKNGQWRAQVTIGGSRLSYTAPTHAECRDWLRKTQTKFDGYLNQSAIELRLSTYLKDGWQLPSPPSGLPPMSSTAR